MGGGGGGKGGSEKSSSHTIKSSNEQHAKLPGLIYSYQQAVDLSY